MEIRTMYNIGDKVFLAEVRINEQATPCPDCNDTRKWKATTPNGQTYDVVCPRCENFRGSQAGFHQHRVTKIHVPHVSELTIGSVRYDDCETPGRKECYMCRETGVGSGALYYLESLYSTREAALEAATRMAAEMDKKVVAENPNMEPVGKITLQGLIDLRLAQYKTMDKAIQNAFQVAWTDLNDVISRNGDEPLRRKAEEIQYALDKELEKHQI